MSSSSPARVPQALDFFPVEVLGEIAKQMGNDTRDGLIALNQLRLTSNTMRGVVSPLVSAQYHSASSYPICRILIPSRSLQIRTQL